MDRGAIRSGDEALRPLDDAAALVDQQSAALVDEESAALGIDIPALPIEEPAERNTGLIVAILAFTGILSALMQTIVVPLIAHLPQLLHTSASNASWVITATLLAAAVTTPISGRLGDMYGKRRILLCCIAILVAGSVLCALTSSFLLVVIGRAMQGMASSVIPLGISIMRDELPSHKVGGAIALMSATLGVGGSVGLLISASVAQNLNWHILFWGAAGIGVLAGCLVIAFVPESPMRHPARFDYIGAIGLSAGLVCLLLPVTKGAQWGWTSPLVIGLLVAALLILLLWGVFEVRVKDALVDLRVSASKSVLLTNIASVLSGFAMYGINLAMPQLLQAPKATGYGFGLSMIAAGLCIAPGGLVMMAVSPVSARTSRRFGPKVTLISGLTVLGVGYALALAAMGAVWQLILVSAVVSTGIALAFGAMPALIMSAAPPDETAAANGLNSLMRFLGSSFSSAVVAAVLANDVMQVGPLSLPTKQAFQWVFVIGAVAAVIAALVATLIPHRRAAVAVQARQHAHAMEHAS